MNHEKNIEENWDINLKDYYKSNFVNLRTGKEPIRISFYIYIIPINS